MPSIPNSSPRLTVAEAGERETLRRLLTHLPEGDALLGPGDDAAVLAAPDQRVVISTDTMIEGADFRLEWSTPEQLGRKAVASNLADIAAMGARPTGLVVALAVPRDTPVDFVEGLARGLAIGLERLAPGVGVVGGDLATSPVVTIAVTVFGSMDGLDPVLRSGARPGDVVAVAGDMGRAAAGLRLLFSGVDAQGRDAQSGTVDEASASLVRAQLAPEPPLYAGVAAARAGSTAMMDLSDGPLLDATRLATASGVTIAIGSQTVAADVEHLRAPLERAFGLDAEGTDALALRLVLGGGEDHALLATFPADAQLPEPFRAIGRVLENLDAPVLVDGEVAQPDGWDPYIGVE
ncbi:thiamine-phosphate kinase [Gulosibacter molinativorax]|uniref:thiamine-phosphate kinase n=1 Tax=Gulosibacter molinativorax TaxID=256821 RepID=UPI00042023C3|nr:thiamine-phosphate kinase [Gulosibacter molinativorax]QUY62454.1 Thiamine-monophosphate kinase [Gulosibacter molinativorax]